VKIGRYEVVPTARAIFRDVKGDDITGLAAAVAYHTLFAVVPLLIFLTALVGVISQAFGIDSVMTDITDWLFNRSGMPAATAEALRGPIERVLEANAGGALGVGALLALWGAKNAVSALMKALNVCFDVAEGRPWLLKTAISSGLTIAVGLGIFVASFALLAGGNIGQAIAGRMGLSDQFQAVWGYVRWILVPVAIALALAVLYWAGPNVKAPFTWLTPGAVISVVLFAVATMALGVYFQYAAGYVTAYGVLGGVLAFVFWLYVMAVIVLLGGSINSVLLKLAGEHSAPRYPAKVDASQTLDRIHADAVGGSTVTAGARDDSGASPAAAGGGPSPDGASPARPRFAGATRALGIAGAAALAAAVTQRLRREDAPAARNR